MKMRRPSIPPLSLPVHTVAIAPITAKNREIGNPSNLQNNATKPVSRSIHWNPSNVAADNGKVSHQNQQRLIFKNGQPNIKQTNFSKLKTFYIEDYFTTLVDAQWRFTLLTFFMSFMLSWLFFAFLWWKIGVLHGDLEPLNIEKMTKDTPEFKPCFENFNGFISAFLFSIETQHTIGYGARYITEECPYAVCVMCLQSIIGLLIQAAMVGIIFAKISRPKGRAESIVFSTKAVICQRDDQLCLMFRVIDLRTSRIISTKTSAQIFLHQLAGQGGPGYQQKELIVEIDSGQLQNFSFHWPLTIVHKIDSRSALYNLTKDDLIAQNFEIVVTLEGVIESTGAAMEARSSYLPLEILWGHNFKPMISLEKDTGQYTVYQPLFNHTIKVDTPVYSAKELNAVHH